MEYVLSDFVNRTEQLGLMWQMARQKIEPRILIVEAAFGMGKSYLIKEFRAQCQEEGIDLVCLDFEEKYEDPGYMYIVKEIWTQLGPAGFDLLTQTIQETTSFSARGRILEEIRKFQAERESGSSSIPADAGEAVQDERSGASPPEKATAGQSGGVNIYGGTNTFRDVAGRDIIHFTQIIQAEDPFVQGKARLWITEVLKQCLVQIAAERRVIFLIDNWQKADGETRRWLARSLVKWTADALLPHVSIMIAGVEVLDLDPRRRIKKVLLPEFEETAAYTYLVDKCGLPMEDVPEIIRVAGGFPLMLVMASARRKKANTYRTGTSP
jgi:hypothetical protein